MPARNPRRTIPIQAISDTSKSSSAIDLRSLVSYLEYEKEPAILLDPSYQILAANTAYQRQFGLAEQAHIGRRCYEVSHHYDVPCDQAGEHCPMKRAQETRGADRILHVHHTPRGQEHVDVELRPIFDDASEIIAYVERLSTVKGASAKPSADGLVGRSPRFNQAIAAVRRAAPSMLPVLLLGESGTGKELFAHALHEASTRSQKPFVVVECSGLTDTLFESELFGYEKGAFTGAVTRKPGLVETAQGGTLFLDEIGDVPLPMQVKLLRLIESGTFRRVGGIETLHSDFRLVAATHKPLKDMMDHGAFRADLYFRISAFPIQLPAVRERIDDLPLLADSILRRIKSANFATSDIPQISPDAMRRLCQYSWPGNIRELRNVLERASLLSDGADIRPEHFEDLFEARSPAIRPLEHAPHRAIWSNKLSDQELLDVVKEFRGMRSELAASIGVSERTLYRRLKALDR